MWIQLLGVAIGLLYLYFEYTANRLVWLASVVMPCISMWVYFTSGLYADFGINIYYLAIAVYGWIKWSRRPAGSSSGDGNRPAIIHTPARLYAPLAAVTGLVWLLLWWILTTFTNSTVPVADSFTTALSVTALWMMARRQAEQWLVWMVVDAVCVGLYVYKGIYGYAGLYAIYTVIAVAGYRKWCLMARESQRSQR